MSGTMGRIQFDNVAGNWQGVVSCLVQLSLAAGAEYTASQYKAQQGHCILEEVAQSSKYSVFPMLVINSFDFSLNGLNSSVLFKSCINESLFG